jgi:hypothetical protein
MKNETSKKEQSCTLHSVMWRILLIIAMACAAAIVGEITPDKYDVGVMFVIGWWCALIWNKVFPLYAT